MVWVWVPEECCTIKHKSGWRRNDHGMLRSPLWMCCVKPNDSWNCMIVSSSSVSEDEVKAKRLCNCFRPLQGSVFSFILFLFSLTSGQRWCAERCLYLCCLKYPLHLQYMMSTPAIWCFLFYSKTNNIYNICTKKIFSKRTFFVLCWMLYFELQTLQATLLKMLVNKNLNYLSFADQLISTLSDEMQWQT